jgi:serine/threonine protein kinase
LEEHKNIPTDAANDETIISSTGQLSQSPVDEAGSDQTRLSAPGEATRPDSADDRTVASTPDTPKAADKATKASPAPGQTQREQGGRSTTTEVGRGTLLQNRYQIKQILGQGGFGAAYLANDIRLDNRECVVKRMLIPRGVSPQQVQLLQANFQREMASLASINNPGHPNLPEIFDYFSDESGNYLVMKYIEGQSLKQIIGADIPWRESVRYIIDVADALDYLHTHKKGEPVMHRDIKPDNILLGNDNRVWLVDFGLAKADPVEGGGDINASMTAGTLGYAPLEQWRGKAVPASDIYALGATLHHLLTGKNPAEAYGGTFNPAKLAQLHGVFTPIRQIKGELPRELEAIIAKATAAEPGERLTALQFKEQLEALISGQAGALYTFKSGESAKTVAELVNLCEKHRKEAQSYLEDGAFQRWFHLINRNDLAAAAEQAVRQGKNAGDRLERFLKLLIPNIALIRLRRAAWRLTRAAIILVLVVGVTLGVIGVAGAFAAGSFIRQTINSVGWKFNNLSLAEPNEFSKAQLDENLQSLIGPYVDKIEVDPRPPDHVDLVGSWNGIPFTVPVAVALQKGKPHLTFSGIGNMPAPFVSGIISQGFNNGIDDAFQNSPVDFTELTITKEGVVVEVAASQQSGRPGLPTPTPTPTLRPTVTPTPPPIATPEGLALVTIFNETGRDIVLELEGEIIEMEVDDTEVIERQPGIYNFIVTFKDTGAIAAEGQKEWTVQTYKWRIQNQP